MKIYFRVVLFLYILFYNLLSYAQYAPSQKKDDCETLQLCLEKMSVLIEKNKNKAPIIMYEENLLALRIADFGDDAVDAMIPLLESNSDGFLYVARNVLQYVERIDDKYFPIIAKEIESGATSLIRALGNIKSSRALSLVKQLYLKKPEGKHEVQALVLQGERAKPFIKEIINCHYGCDERTYGLLSKAMSGADKSVRVYSSHQLFDQIYYGDLSKQSVEKLLKYIEVLDASNNQLEKKLLSIREDFPSLDNEINRVLSVIGSSLAGEIFADKLKALGAHNAVKDLILSVDGQEHLAKQVDDFFESNDEKLKLLAYAVDPYGGSTEQVLFIVERFGGANNVRYKAYIENNNSVEGVLDITEEEALTNLLRAVSNEGRDVYSVGPEIIKLLSSEKKEIRLTAIGVLGDIGYTPAIDDIANFLDDPRDIRANDKAAVVLAKLKSEDSIDLLNRTLGEHWYPPVKEQLKRSISFIKGESDRIVEERLALEIPFRYFRYDVRCDEIYHTKIKEPEEIKIYDKKILKDLTFKSEYTEYGLLEELPELKLENANEWFETKYEHIEELGWVEVKKISSPELYMARRVDGGIFLGTNRGEFGGDLVFVDDHGNEQTVLKANIEDVYELDNQLLVVADFGHARGHIYRLENIKGKWVAKEWRELPGAPFRSWLIDTNELFIGTGEGDVILSKNGDLRMAECKK